MSVLWFKADTGQPFQVLCGDDVIDLAGLAMRMQLECRGMELDGVMMSNRSGYVPLAQVQQVLGGSGRSADTAIRVSGKKAGELPEGVKLAAQ